MDHERESSRPIERPARLVRRRLSLKGEFALALLPTLVVLAVLSLVELLSRQRLLFASLASSAFLIHLDPQHGTNRVRTLVMSQMLAALVGFAAYGLVGPAHSYVAGGATMVVTIAAIGLAVLITAVLVVLQRAATWSLARAARGTPERPISEDPR